MPDQLSTSRRDFLKLLGAAAAAPLVAPLEPLVSVAPALAEVAPELALPPEVLHVWDRGAWRAVSGVRSFGVRFPRSDIVLRSLDSLMPNRALLNDGPTLDLELWLPHAGESVVREMLTTRNWRRRCAVTLSGTCLEFEAEVRELSYSISVSPGDQLEARFVADVLGDVALRELGVG